MSFTEGQVEAYCQILHDVYERAAIRQGLFSRDPAPWVEVPEVAKRALRETMRVLLPAITSNGAEAAVRAAHPRCSADTCTTMLALETYHGVP